MTKSVKKSDENIKKSGQSKSANQRVLFEKQLKTRMLFSRLNCKQNRYFIVISEIRTEPREIECQQNGIPMN